MNRGLVLLSSVGLPAHANPISSDAGSHLLSADYLLQVVGSFFLVICALVAVLAVMKRFGATGKSSTPLINEVASIQLGQKERIVLLQIGDEQVLVGVTSHAINTLRELSSPISLPEIEASRSLADVLRFARIAPGSNK